MSADRSRQLFEAVDQFNMVHAAWSEDDNAPHPTLAYWRAFETMLSMFESGDIPVNCRALTTAVYELAARKVEFDESDEVDLTESFKASRERLEEVAKQLRSPEEKRKLEPIAELKRQGVPDEQIARIWGLRRSDGTGIAHLVQQELNQPGSVIGPDYVHPNDVKQQQTMDAARDRYIALARESGEQKVRQVEDDTKPCPETPRELWLIGVSTQQAAKMLKVDQSAVSRMWEQFEAEKLAAAGQTSPAATPAPAVEESGLEEQAIDPLTGEDPTLDEDDDEIDDEDDPYAEFKTWSDDDIKAEAKRLKIRIRGTYERTKAMDSIMRKWSQLPEEQEAAAAK